MPERIRKPKWLPEREDLPLLDKQKSQHTLKITAGCWLLNFSLHLPPPLASLTLEALSMLGEAVT